MHYFNPFDGITLYLSITSLTTTCSFIGRVIYMDMFLQGLQATEH